MFVTLFAYQVRLFRQFNINSSYPRQTLLDEFAYPGAGREGSSEPRDAANLASERCSTFRNLAVLPAVSGV